MVAHHALLLWCHQKTADKKWISKWQKINLRLFSISKTLISPESGKEKNRKSGIRTFEISRTTGTRRDVRLGPNMHHLHPFACLTFNAIQVRQNWRIKFIAKTNVSGFELTAVEENHLYDRISSPLTRCPGKVSTHQLQLHRGLHNDRHKIKYQLSSVKLYH